jgi:hypothetical protein
VTGSIQRIAAPSLPAAPPSSVMNSRRFIRSPRRRGRGGWAALRGRALSRWSG